MNPRNLPDPNEPLLVDELALLRAIIDAVPDPIFCKDAQGRYLLTNRAHSERLGVPHGSCLGKTVFEMKGIDPELARLYHEDDLKVLATGEAIINREEPFPQLDGSHGWFLTSKFPLRDADARVIGLVGIARDITEMRRATEELDRARQRLADHVENSPLAIIEWQPDFRVERWAGRAEAMFGWNAAEVVGKHFDDWPFVHPGDAAIVGDISTRLLDGRDLRNVCHNRNLTRDGCTLHCVWHNSALRDAEGRLISFFSLVEDVTERVHAEQAARESESHYRALVEATDTGYVVVDERGCVLEANAEYVRQTGHATFAEIRGRCVLEWTALHDHERNAREVALCVSTGSTRHLEIDYVWPDGRIVPIDINASFIDDSGGRRIIALCRDITDRRAAERERQRMERKLQDAQKLESLGVLAGGIAHDFNNLLTGILGHASLAGMELPEDSPVRPCIEQIETASSRAADLCQQMLAYSGKGRFVIRTLDLNAVIGETTDLLRVSIGKNAALTLDLATRLPAVRADATQFRQIVMNLVINASEALGERGGVIRVSTGVVRAERETFTEAHLAPDLPPGDYVFLEVADNGAGMDAEVRARIFDPFFTTKFTGRGLGLAAVLGIVRGHGGALQVESEPGKGTTFRILLPPCADQPAAEVRAPAVETGWRGSGTVLVIDDEASVRDATTRMLHSLGFEVQLAVDGVDGVEVFRANPRGFAVVLLDLTMPRLGGSGVFEAVRALNPDVPVVMMSGYNEGEVAARFGPESPAAFLQKPFDLPLLRGKLQSVLG